MHKYLLVVIFIGSFSFSWSQSRVYGKVVRLDDGIGLANANVFITNTSKGTRTDTEGNFALENVPVGNYDVIISCIGYSTITYSYTPTQLPLRLLIKMEVKVKEEETVTVKPFEKDGWEKWGKTFLDSYLGVTENREHCEVTNKDVLKFRFLRKENILEVVATDLIIIRNKKLGYLIKHQLEGFEINFNQKSTVNYGYPYFEEIETNRKNKIKKYKKEREKAYYGSLMHLMRSIYRDSVTQEGFVIRDLQKQENMEKKRVRSIVQNQFKRQPYDTLNMTTNTRVLKIDFSDTSRYYNRIMQQPDFFDILGKSYNAKDICFIDSTTVLHKIITFPNQLYIEFKNEKQDERYYTFQIGKYRTLYQTTKLFFINDFKKVQLFENGCFYNPLSIFLDGYMGWEKMADLLPLDYELEK